MSAAVKRSYDSSRRQDQAQQTERVVLAAASELFIAQGYGRTTLAQVAQQAGVSVETVYRRFRNKPGLLHRVWDVTSGGDDDDVLFHERPEVQAITAEPDLARRLAMQARLMTKTVRRTAPLLLMLQSAASADPVAAQMLQEASSQRLVGLGFMAKAAAATGQLAVSELACRDLIWAHSDGMLWHRLVIERGWSDEQFADYLARAWIAGLVEPARGS